MLPRRTAKPGPILDYINALSAGGQHEAVEKIHDAVRACLATRDGAILLDLLSKSTEEFFLPPDADPRALETLNAQRFIVLDLRRIVSDEYERQRQAIEASQGSRRRGRGLG